MFRHWALFYRVRKKLKNGIKLHIDLTKKRFNLLLDAQLFIQDKENAEYVYGNINTPINTLAALVVSLEDWN